MTEQLITTIYEKLKNFNDPVSNKALNRTNRDLNIVCKDGHANITLNINPKEEVKYNKLSIDLNNTLKEIDGLLSINIVFTAEKNLIPKQKKKDVFKYKQKILLQSLAVKEVLVNLHLQLILP